VLCRKGQTTHKPVRFGGPALQGAVRGPGISSMDDLLNEFLTETAESIDVVDVELVKLEQDPNNKAVIDNIFRLVHTIKGTCGFLGLPRLEAVAHASENVLGRFRDGDIEVTSDSVTVVLESLDRIKEILAGLERTEQEPEGDDSELIARLDAILEEPTATPATSPSEETDQPSRSMDAAEDVEEKGEESVDPKLGRALKPGEVPLDELERAFQEAEGPETVQHGLTTPEPGAPARSQSAERLFERVGGADTIAVAAHLLGNRAARHAKLSDIFSEMPEDMLKAKFTGLLTALFKDDDTAANNVVATLIADAEFGEEHFDALTALAKEVFEEIQFDQETRDDGCMSLELGRQTALEKSQSKANAGAAKSPAGQQEESGAQAQGERRSGQSIRVSVDLLEDLMNIVSELVLTRNQLLQMTRQDEDSPYTVPVQRLSQTTTELQEGVMKTRMQPIGNAWSKLPRIIRDLSVELDKKIELEMNGAETELDRQVLELIKDPLTHMVRNSADHGVETPAERLAMGKPETGTIQLNAYHEGGHIIIEIKDDGRGISVEKIRRKILEKGLNTEARFRSIFSTPAFRPPPR